MPEHVGKKLRRNITAGALVVLGAGIVMQPSGAVRAEDSSVSQKAGKGTKSATDPIELKTNSATGQYLRKKLPGRMKSGTLTVTRQGDGAANPTPQTEPPKP
jgi:hypothetical protein